MRIFRFFIVPFALILCIGSDYAVFDFASYTEPISGSDLTIEMVAIRGGAFFAGSPETEKFHKADEGPVHEVEIGDFWMSTLEITWDQYEQFLYREKDRILTENKGNINLAIDGVSGATMPYVNFNKPGYPLINITQYAASTFCKWLTAKTGRFYRLPTEAEWEYACRAGVSGPYSIGEESIGEYAWYKDNSEGAYHKGGLKKSNAYGLFDMHGNVAEWVLDSYDQNYYQKIQDAKNPLLLGEKLYPRVVRGGSWKDEAANLRSAARAYSDPKWKRRDPQFPKSLWWLTDATHVGFRIVRPKSLPSKEEMEKYWGKPIEEY